MTLTGKNKTKTLKVSRLHLTSCMNFRMIQAVIKSFERSAVGRIEENSNDVYDDVNKCTQIRPRRNEERKVGK